MNQQEFSSYCSDALKLVKLLTGIAPHMNGTHPDVGFSNQFPLSSKTCPTKQPVHGTCLKHVNIP